MHGKHVTIVDVGRVVRIQNLIRYEANTGFSNAEKPVLKPNRKTGSQTESKNRFIRFFPYRYTTLIRKRHVRFCNLFTVNDYVHLNTEYT